MTGRQVGRPKAGQQHISSERIITKAIEILNTNPFGSLSMRQIAKAMSVNPMALYHYFPDKDALINEIANTLYQSITRQDLPYPQQIEQLLLDYREKVINYPQITLAIFHSPALFPEQAQRVTDILISQLTELGLTAQHANTWAYMLIDYTHGEALASQPNRQNNPLTPNEIKLVQCHYHETIKMLLATIK